MRPSSTWNASSRLPRTSSGSPPLPAGAGLRVRYEQEADGGQRVSTLQYVLFLDGTGYILTYTTRPDRNAEYERDFARSAESFRLLDGS